MRTLLLAVAFAVAIASVCVTQPENLSRRTLTFAQRVSYQRAIEEVYWRHRIWPKDNPQQKPPLAAIVSEAQLERKVEDYLRKSQLVTDQWQSPITASELQAEMERMAAHTKQPEVLRELFEALGNDPFVIAECLARPAVAERLVTNLSCNDRDQFHTSRASAENQMGKLIAAASSNYKLPTMSGAPNGCTDDTWTATSTTNAPSPRDGHTAVWTGTEMIVWGGHQQPDVLNTGGRYNPSTDTWTATSTTNAPNARAEHTAVWTGSEMIVWGGICCGGSDLNTGGRYNPATDSWTATSTANAPDARLIHTAVWTGSQMIVWGGQGPLPPPGFFNTGGRYNPSTDSWTATSTINAPAARAYDTAVWTGSEMIVWGGSPYTNTGGRYEPGTDSWTATSLTNAPEARGYHTAVWTGSQMIVWGGSSGFPLNTGGKYNPGTNTWTATATTNAPSMRAGHTAVWIGNEMILWGGFDDNFNIFNTGGRYNPGTNSWIATSISNAPEGRFSHTAVWTGSEMIVWGGIVDLFNNTDTNTGGRYCAQSGPPPSPTPTATASSTPTPTTTATSTPRPAPTARPRPTPVPRP